jgi:hypothetical protein
MSLTILKCICILIINICITGGILKITNFDNRFVLLLSCYYFLFLLIYFSMEEDEEEDIGSQNNTVSNFSSVDLESL